MSDEPSPNSPGRPVFDQRTVASVPRETEETMSHQQLQELDQNCVSNERPESKSPPGGQGSKRSMGRGNRPSLQIYRPPGLRSGSSNKAPDPATTVTSPPSSISTTGSNTIEHYSAHKDAQNGNIDSQPLVAKQQQQHNSSNKQHQRKKENSFDSNTSSESQSINNKSAESKEPIKTAGSKQSHMSNAHAQGGKQRQSNERPRPRTPTKQYGQQRQNSRPLITTPDTNGQPLTQTKQSEQSSNSSHPISKENSPSLANQQAARNKRKPSPGPNNAQQQKNSPKNGSNQRGSSSPANSSGPRSPGPIRKRGPSPGPENGASQGSGMGTSSQGSGGYRLPGRQNSFVKEVEKKKKAMLSPGDVEDIKELIQKLQIKSGEMMLSFIKSGFESPDLAPPVAQSLVQSAIEEGKGSKGVAKLCSLLMEASTGEAFHQGLITASWEYYECREKLRSEHFKFWLAFVNFVSDLYAAIGFTYEGELVEILFRIFEFMLRSPVLETLKIEELECLISALLSVGYDLERQCPDKLSRLREWIRDAFIHAQEPWARKMILLLVELSASGWKLPAESNDYYFQAAASSL